MHERTGRRANYFTRVLTDFGVREVVKHFIIKAATIQAEFPSATVIPAQAGSGNPLITGTF